MKTAHLTAELVRKLLDYDEASGFLTRKSKSGVRAGWLESNGYRYISVDSVVFREHRIIWLLVHGEWPKGQIDHINHDRADNRLANLRDVTASENQHNQTRPSNHNLVGWRGVRKNGRDKTYRAEIRINNNIINLGRFATGDEAHAAYLAAKDAAFPGLLTKECP